MQEWYDNAPVSQNTKNGRNLQFPHYNGKISMERAAAISRNLRAPIFRKSASQPGFYTVTYVTGDKINHIRFQILTDGKVKDQSGVKYKSLNDFARYIYSIIRRSHGRNLSVFEGSERFYGNITPDEAARISATIGKPVYYKNPKYDLYEAAFMKNGAPHHVGLSQVPSGLYNVNIATSENYTRMTGKQQERLGKTFKNVNSWMRRQQNSSNEPQAVSVSNRNNPQGGRRKTQRRKNRKNRTRKH